jgi:hypothetical protein
LIHELVEHLFAIGANTSVGPQTEPRSERLCGRAHLVADYEQAAD